MLPNEFDSETRMAHNIFCMSLNCESCSNIDVCNRLLKNGKIKRKEIKPKINNIDNILDEISNMLDD